MNNNYDVLAENFSASEVSVLFDYLYLGENNKESGKPGAWEELWKETRDTKHNWCAAINKVYELHLQDKINSEVVFQYITKKG